jgi:hypothetical protein
MKAMSWMRAMPWRVQLAVILAGYAAVLVYGATTVYMRDLAALRDPLSSSGGMWAFGDELLAWNIFFLFMVPTFFLLWLMRQYDDTYTVYAKVLFWVGLTAPIFLGIFLLRWSPRLKDVADWFGWRPWRAPFVFIVMGLSRMMSPRVDVAKRMITRALLIEGGTLAIFISLIIFGR